MMTTDDPSTSSNPYAPPRASVRDIVDPAAGMEPADRGARLVAAILDTLIFGVMVYAPLLISVAMAPVDPASASFDAVLGGAAIFTLIGFIVWAVLTIRFVMQNGQSIGKKMVKIKVVRPDGGRATINRIFWLRNIVNGILSIIPLYGLIDVLFIFGESRRCLHDRIADTTVVKA